MIGGTPYRGRIAPTPTGYLHVGHAATFRRAAERCEEAGGTMVFRLEDLDPLRCKAEYCDAALEDLRWLGLTWAEGPDVGGPCGPYRQSERRPHFLAAWRALRDGGWIYPCARSRKEVATAALAPHEEESVFPPEWRVPVEQASEWSDPAGTNWRFRVPDGEAVEFVDGHFGPTRRVAGVDFGDFLIWNRDNVPAYELAVVVDDIAMGITEVVRGADLLTSTARQILLYRAFAATVPGFFHCPLVVDEHGRRLAKRTGALALRTLREQGRRPQDIGI